MISIDASSARNQTVISPIGDALTKLFTTFYWFMGTTLNTAYGSTVTESSKAKIAANLLLTLSVPAVLAALLRAALVGGDDDVPADAPEAAGVEALSAGLRAQFDPRGLFRAGMEH